jgi:hypothetical protein
LKGDERILGDSDLKDIHEEYFSLAVPGFTMNTPTIITAAAMAV